MKSIKKALCSVLICFGTAMFFTSTADASEGTEVVNTETAENNFVDNNVTEENVTINNVPVDNYVVNAVTETAISEAVASQVPVTEIQSEIAETANVETAAVNETVVAGGEKNNKKQTKTKKYNKADLRLMSAIIYCEAGSEPYAGKVAVGIVVMNRVKSKSFPNTIKKVIYQKSQFSPARNGSLKRALARYDAGKFNSKLEKQCIKAAKEALDGVKSVSYAGSTKNMESFHYFSGSLRGAKYKIKGHKFK